MFNVLKKSILCLLVLFVFVFNYQIDGYGNTITNALIMVFISLEMISVLNRMKLKSTKEIFSFGVFFIISTISCGYSFNFGDSLIKIKTLLILFFLLITINDFLSNDKKNLLLYTKAIAISGIFAGLYVILNYNWTSGVRANNLIGDSNQVGAYLAYSFTLLLYLYKTNQLNKTISIGGLVIIFVSNIISGSRSALIVTVIGFILFFYFLSPKNKKEYAKKCMYVIIAIVFIFALYNLIMNNKMLYEIIGKRYVSFFEILSGKESSINEKSTGIRLNLIQLAWGQFTQSVNTIFFGNGIGFFASYWYSIGGNYAFCHNNYLELLSGIGIFGTISYYYIYIKIFLNQFKKIKNNREEAALSISILIQMFLMHWFVVFYYQKCEILVLALLIHLNNKVNEKERM